MKQLSQIRSSLEGGLPVALATQSVSGVPNVTFISQLFYVDEERLAVPVQYLNKTWANIKENPRATVLLTDPRSMATYRLHLRYSHRESSGPIYSRLRAQLGSIATQFGGETAFCLVGADIYVLEELEEVAPPAISAPPDTRDLGSTVSQGTLQLASCGDLDDFIGSLQQFLLEDLGCEHFMFYLHDPLAKRLHLLASGGYSQVGTGTEIPVGVGVIGLCASERVPVRLGHLRSAVSFNNAVLRNSQKARSLVSSHPYPGLKNPGSQLALPVATDSGLLGVLLIESEAYFAFNYRFEDAALRFAAELARLLAKDAEAEGVSAKIEANHPPSRYEVRCIGEDHALFIGDKYVTRGMVGKLLWQLLGTYSISHQVHFGINEVGVACDSGTSGTRVQAAHLYLLQQCLRQGRHPVQIEWTSKSRFQLVVLGEPVLANLH